MSKFSKELHYYVHESSFVDSSAIIGKDTKIWHFSHLMKNCKLGNNCNIGQNVVISPDVILGDNCKVQNNVSIYTGVICGDDVFLGPSVVFTNVRNPRSMVNRRGKYTRTIIENGATIGANATIVCGNQIGEFAFIGAGAVLTKNALPFSLMAGNPAKRIGWMSRCGHKLLFNTCNEAVCPETGDVYRLEGDKVSLIK